MIEANHVQYCWIAMSMHSIHYVPFLHATAATAVTRLSHHISVCPSYGYGWISQKRCKL